MKNKKMQDTQEVFFTVDQIAEKLQVKAETVRIWCRTGKIMAYKVGGKSWRIKQKDLEKFVESDAP